MPSPPDAAASGHSVEDAPAGAVTILVCATCRLRDVPATDVRPGALLVADTRAAAEGTGVRVRAVGCLGNCSRGLSAAVYRAGCWSYVFGGLGAESGGDLVAGALLFSGSADGFMPFRARPEALKRGLIARIPHPDHLEDLP